MGLIDYLYKFLGFEADDTKIVQKKRKTTKASYNLKEKTKSLPTDIDGVKIYYPENFEECKNKISLLEKEIPFFLDFRFCSTQDKAKALNYFDGVITILGVTEELIEKNLYAFLPKNIEIERE